jgi:hypothetical protein
MPWPKKKPRGDKVQCEAVKENGEQCRGFALVESYDSPDGPRCRVHAMSAEERSASSRRMAARSAVRRHNDLDAAPRLSGLEGTVTLAEVLFVVREALDARFPITHEEDWGTRLAACGTLLSAFPRDMRRTPGEIRDLIRVAVPEEVRTPEMEDAARVYKELRAKWDSLDGIRWSDLKGLYVLPYPEWCIAPFENRYYLQGKQTRPRGKVKRGLDGSVSLEREEQFPLLVPSEEPPAEHQSEWPNLSDTEAVAW